MDRGRRRGRWAAASAALAVAVVLGAVAPSAALGFGFITSWGGPGVGNGQFAEPSDVAVGPDFDVYVTDREPNNRVQVFSPLGVFKRAFATTDSFGLDVVGDTVYVSDFSNDAVQVFSAQGAALRTLGSAGSRTDPGQPRFREPWHIDVGGPAGNVYVADSVNGRIVEATPTGAFVRELGFGPLSSPFGVAATPSGSVYVADTGNNQIRRLDPGGGGGPPFGGPGSGDGQLNSPWDLAFDPNGDLLVLDRFNNRVQRFTTNGQFLGKFGSVGGGPGELQSPEGLAVDAAGNVYVADAGNNRVVRFGDRANLSTAVTSLAPATLTAGETATLTARIANAGPDASRLAGVRVDLPAGAEPVAASATQGTCALGRPVICAVGTIPAAGALGVTVTFRATAAGVLPVTATAGSPTYDPDPTNDAASGSVTAGAAGVAGGPSLRVAFARFHATWKRSHPSGTLEVTVNTPRAARVEVALLRGAGAAALHATTKKTARPVQRWSVALPRAGQSTRRLKLSRSLLPGAYTLRLREVGAPAGGALAGGTRAVRLAAPPEGVASSAFVSRGVGGKGVRRITGTLPGFIFANFRLAAAPRTPSRLRVEWFWSGKAGTVTSKRVRPVRGLAVSPLRNARGPLPPGIYRAVLTYGSTVVASASVRLG